jgi:hypothetical protein
MYVLSGTKATSERSKRHGALHDALPSVPTVPKLASSNRKFFLGIDISSRWQLVFRLPRSGTVFRVMKRCVCALRSKASDAPLLRKASFRDRKRCMRNTQKISIGKCLNLSSFKAYPHCLTFGPRAVVDL